MDRLWVLLLVLVASAAAKAQDTADATTTDAAAGGEGCDAALVDSYNQGLAVASIFVVLVGSFIGAALPALFAMGRHPAFMVVIKVSSAPY
jgi:hypothetical protein